MWWKANPQDLHRVADRVSSVYVERSHIDRDENAVVVLNREHTIRVPAAFVAVMLIGPGSRITHGAVRLLADSGTSICWVGEHGVRMYASGLGPSRGARLLMRQAYLVTRPHERLQVARRMYAMRFPDEDVSALTMQQLRGREGTRVRRIYKQHAERTGVPWSRRSYKAGDAFAAGDDVNRLVSATNAALYGVCHAAIAGLGVSPGLGFIHTGSATSFVMDIADLYKADLTIPLAFDLAAQGRTSERDARLAFRARLVEVNLLPKIILDIKALLEPESDSEDEPTNKLWDERLGTVPGGLNWSSMDEDDLVEAADPVPEQHLTVVGPELDDHRDDDQEEA